MQASEVARSPLTVCVDQLQHSAGPAAMKDNAGLLSVKLLNPAATLQACARIVEDDLGLTLRLLRIANSAMFNQTGRTVTNITHAAALLGTDALTQLIASTPSTPLPRPARELVVLSELAGTIARKLMRILEPRWADEAFISGLMRNLGEVLFAIERPEEYREILLRSQRSLAGLRAAGRTQLQFDFDELTAALLGAWSLHGAPVLSAQSTPEALVGQSGNPDAPVALAADIAHYAVMAYFRAEPAEKDLLLKHALGPLTAVFGLREGHLHELCDESCESIRKIMASSSVTREQLRFREWIPTQKAAPTVPAKKSLLDLPGTAGLDGVLERAVARGVDRAAFLRFMDPTLYLMSSAGAWPEGTAARLAGLITPARPPFLIAFKQRQDIWIDCVKDLRFEDSPLVQTLRPSAFFLLPVHDGKKTIGCLYCDWHAPRPQPPESALAFLAAIREFIVTKRLAG